MSPEEPVEMCARKRIEKKRRGSSFEVSNTGCSARGGVGDSCRGEEVVDGRGERLRASVVGARCVR
jgi:hypothetical protein